MGGTIFKRKERIEEFLHFNFFFFRFKLEKKCLTESFYDLPRRDR